MRDGLIRLIDQRIENFKPELAVAGLERLLEMTERLKEVDDNWRATNPAKAAEFPPA
jgi:hypothetical protein